MIGARILLVDDETVFTDNVSKLLEARGYIVTVADSGPSALRSLEQGFYDVVVLDLKMPGMDGVAALRKMKKLPLFTEVLILTGHGSIDSALEALKLGAYDYLTKPCEIDELVKKIEGAWTKKDGAEKQDLENKVKKMIESPLSAYDLFPKKKRP